MPNNSVKGEETLTLSLTLHSQCSLKTKSKWVSEWDTTEIDSVNANLCIGNLTTSNRYEELTQYNSHYQMTFRATVVLKY